MKQLLRLVAPAAILLAVLPSRAQTLRVQDLEAVDASGFSAWSGPLPFILTNVVLLNDVDEMLDATPNFIPWNSGAGAYQMGGQWQVFVQATEPGDRGGVECWMGQNYGNLPWQHSSSLSYDNTAWSNEVTRVSHDPATSRAFHKGDLVNVTANGSLFYGGMQNINEEHSTDPACNFTLSLVRSDYGLPAPEVISLASVIGTNLSATGHYDLFDPTRATGGEHWQGMRVRINGLTLVTTDGWTTNADWALRHCTASDGEGRQLPLIHPLYDLGPAPTGRFDVTGIFLQESGSGTDGTFGYKLFVQETEPSALATLSIALEPVAMKPVVTWPGSLANYQLQSTDSATSTNWAAVTNVPALVNGRNTVILDPAGAQTRFYRLKRVQ
jgi:hypothetical protein